jgi:hypothetical protein
MLHQNYENSILETILAKVFQDARDNFMCSFKIFADILVVARVNN